MQWSLWGQNYIAFMIIILMFYPPVFISIIESDASHKFIIWLFPEEAFFFFQKGHSPMFIWVFHTFCNLYNHFQSTLPLTQFILDYLYTISHFWIMISTESTLFTINLLFQKLLLYKYEQAIWIISHFDVYSSSFYPLWSIIWLLLYLALFLFVTHTIV